MPRNEIIESVPVAGQIAPVFAGDGPSGGTQLVYQGGGCRKARNATARQSAKSNPINGRI